MDDLNQELKMDAGKPRLSLVPTASIKAIGEVMTYGLTKHELDSWKKVEKWRYKDALIRHIIEYLEEPNSIDKESGLPHLHHAICNLAFLCELELKGVKE